MEHKKASETGIRVEIPQGTDEAAGIDQVVSDFLRGDTHAVLRDLHEPGGEAEAAKED
jgi:hypothetical protein